MSLPSSAPPLPLLEVRGLGYSYGSRRAVDGASFFIRPGEVFGFLGPNGAGKTTTISCIAGLRGGYDGELLFEARRFEPARSAADRAKLGLVPQQIALYDGLSARENLEFFGRMAGLSGARLGEAVRRALALAGLPDRAGAPPAG